MSKANRGVQRSTKAALKAASVVVPRPKLRKGDNVIVLSGKDRGKTGRIEAVLAAKGRVVVTGVNIMKKSIKKSAQAKQVGIIEFPAPLHISNVAIVDPKTGKASRIGYGSTGSGATKRKTRISKASGQELVVETA